MKRIERVLLCIMVFACSMLIAADCGAKVKVKSVRVKSNYGKIVHVGKGKKVKVTVNVKVKPNKKTYKGVRFRSKNKKIATINAIGQITGKKVGTTRIYVTSKKNKKKKASMKVKVVKPLKKIILKENSKTLTVGDTYTIKKSVVPSNTGFKTVVWSSSSSAVAKVNSAGKVTARAAGDVKITAKAVDGSGTRAVCKIKVLALDAVNVTEVQTLSANTLRVTFDKEVTLDKKSFSVNGKLSQSGTYNKYYTVSIARTRDKKVYDLRVNKKNTFKENSYVKVAIDSLPGNGVKSLETEVSFVDLYKPKDAYIMGTAGHYITPSPYDLSQYGVGSLVYQIGELPVGLTYSVSDNTVTFSGKPTQSEFGKMTRLSVNDETDKFFNTSIYWYIGDDKNIVGYAEKRTFLTGEKISEEMGDVLHIIGGSGEYEYSFSGLPSGMQGDEKTGKIFGTVLAANDYVVRITVYDKADKSVKCTVSSEIRVENGYTISGIVQEQQGIGIGGCHVQFSDNDGLNTYNVKTDENGKYNVRVAAGTYQGRAYMNTNDVVEDDIYQWAIDGDTTVDFVPDCYKAVLTYDSEKYMVTDIAWTSNRQDGAVYEGTKWIYLAPGIYDISMNAVKKDETTGKNTPYILTAQFRFAEIPGLIDAIAEPVETQTETSMVEEKKED